MKRMEKNAEDLNNESNDDEFISREDIENLDETDDVNFQ